MELIVDAKAVLGEGPCWDAKNNQLYWVDIEGYTVHIYDPVSKLDLAVPVGEYVSLVVPRASGGLVVALQNGFYYLDLASSSCSLIREVEGDIKTNRFNDGKCDAYGRLWAGTMDIEQRHTYGALYCMDTSLTVRKVLDGVGISNGLGFSPDNTQMYFIDTPTRQVVRFDYDLESGTIHNGSIIIRIDDGYPDGMCVDADGMLWIAHWGGSKVSRWNPYTETRLEEYILPVTNVTSCTFGGQSLCDLYITTARSGLAKEKLESETQAGGLFRKTFATKGQPTFAFGG